MIDAALRLYTEVAREHRTTIDTARRAVTLGEDGACARALVAIDEAMRDLAEVQSVRRSLTADPPG